MAKSDLFIMIPAHIIDAQQTKIRANNQVIPHGVAAHFKKDMDQIFDYEVVDRFAKTCKRHYLGAYTFVVLSDDFDNPAEVDTLEVMLFANVIDRTQLAAVTIMVMEYDKDITIIMDQVSRENIMIRTQCETLALDLFLEKTFGLIKNGEAKMCLVQDTCDDRTERIYRLAAETKVSNVMTARIMSRKLDFYAKHNLAVYDNSELYASESVVLQLYKDYDKSEQDKITQEVFLVFIIELIVFQISALNRTSKQISDTLITSHNAKLKTVEASRAQFSKTMALWDVNIFRYNTAQTVYNRIAKRFGIDGLLKHYRSNSQMLDDLVHIKNTRSAVRESRILFVIAILLFIGELYQLIKAFIQVITEGGSLVSAIGFFVSGISIVFIIVIIVLIYFLRRRNP